MTTVLLIEDNLEIRENTTEILEMHGFNVIGAENGRIGIEKTFEMMPDIILCDIMMPEADGYEVLRSIKSSDKTSAIPFIFLTASVERKEVQAGFDLGACGYVRKPFEINELMTAIESCLQQVQNLKA
ncbi:MAG TPA: response regulator [Bacteroidia bacterium]